MRHSLSALVLCLGAALTASAAPTLEDVLSKMDAASPKFTGMSAALDRTTYTKVLDDKTVESGQIRLRRTGKELVVLIDLTKPDNKVVGFRGKKAEIFYPKLNTVQIYDLGKHSDLVDQFMLVGFGTSGRELKSSYKMKFAGEETVKGRKVWKLELLPSVAAVKEKLQRVELWIDPETASPVQQKFVQPSGDYYLFTYDAIKLNPSLAEEDLRLKLPKGVKREYPQK